VKDLAFRITNLSKTAYAVPLFGTDFGSAGYIALASKFYGNPLTLSVSTTGGGITATLTDNLVTASRSNGLQFGSVSSGVLSKNSDIWSGVAVANGTAGWFRFVANPTDSGGASTTSIRLDGSVGTVSADLIVTSTNIVSGATITVDSCSVTIPAY